MNIKTANRLCELRKKHNLSQEELASKLGVSRQAVSKWERSESSPDTDNLIQLAALYKISLDELLNGNEAISLIEENNYFEEETLIDECKVQLKGDEIKVIDGEAERRFSLNKLLQWNDKNHSISNAITSGTAILFTALYLTLGFLVSGFGKYWFLFILIPVPESLFKAIYRGRGREFNIACLVTATYCALGALFNLWHPLWVLFFLIPIYYLFDKLMINQESRYKQIAIDGYYKLHPNQKKDEDDE